MPLPVITNLYLARFIWRDDNAPRDAVNDLFFHDDAGGHTGTDVFNAIDAHVQADMWDFQQEGSRIAVVKTTKLDGSAATIDHETAVASRWKGQTTGGQFILAATNVITLRTGFRGRSRRGRVYCPWVAEAAQSDGVLDSPTVTTVSAAWETFRSAMKTAGFPLHVCSRLHNDSIEVVSVTCQPYVKSQRRRNRR